MTERLFSQETGLGLYLRREDTLLAQGLRMISPKIGADYLASPERRIVGQTIAALCLPAAAVIIGAEAVLSKIDEPRGKIFFVHKRIGENGEEISVYKIRTMREGAENPQESISTNISGTAPEEDKRNTALGRKIRAFELDELPQLVQAAIGKIPLFGTRIIPLYAINHVKENRPRTFSDWFSKYKTGGPGILNLLSAVGNDRKNNLRRYHYDMLYLRKASLGLNFYIIYRTGRRMLEKLKNKIGRTTQATFDNLHQEFSPSSSESLSSLDTEHQI